MRRLFVAAVLCSSGTLATAQGVRIADELTFTSTQTWASDLFKFTVLDAITPGVALPPPPKNSNIVTQKDLAVLHAYQNARTAEQVAEIKQELTLQGMLFAGKSYDELVHPVNRPQTFALMQDLIALETVNLMVLKQIYNRVRPSYLDTTLKPAIDVPQHPAYPSGHATQAHLRALVLSELDPANRAAYVQSAERIARNREIAGLHYPSDSQAGALLASQLFKVLMNKAYFAEKLKKAKSEWTK